MVRFDSKMLHFRAAIEDLKPPNVRFPAPAAHRKPQLNDCLAAADRMELTMCHCLTAAMHPEAKLADFLAATDYFSRTSVKPAAVGPTRPQSQRRTRAATSVALAIGTWEERLPFVRTMNFLVKGKRTNSTRCVFPPRRLRLIRKSATGRDTIRPSCVLQNQGIGYNTLRLRESNGESHSAQRLLDWPLRGDAKRGAGLWERNGVVRLLEAP